MKKLFLMAAAGTMLLAACDSEKKEVVKDYPVVGDFSLYASYDTTNPVRMASWLDSDSFGVFVTSEGVMQSNLQYMPDESVEPFEVLPGVFMLPTDENYNNISVTETAISATGDKAGFKQGEHVIYAYYPYNADATDLTAVPVPDTTVQDATEESALFEVHPKYVFGYAKTSVSKYSAQAVNLDFTCPYTEINTGAFNFPDETLGKTFVKAVITGSAPIAYPAYNLVAGEFAGEPAYTIEYIQPETIEGGWFGNSTGGAKFSVAADMKTAETISFTIKAVFEDGTEYTAEVEATPEFTAKDWDTGEMVPQGYISFGQVDFE